MLCVNSCKSQLQVQTACLAAEGTGIDLDQNSTTAVPAAVRPPSALLALESSFSATGSDNDARNYRVCSRELPVIPFNETLLSCLPLAQICTSTSNYRLCSSGLPMTSFLYTLLSCRLLAHCSTSHVGSMFCSQTHMPRLMLHVKCCCFRS